MGDGSTTLGFGEALKSLELVPALTEIEQLEAFVEMRMMQRRATRREVYALRRYRRWPDPATEYELADVCFCLAVDGDRASRQDAMGLLRMMNGKPPMP